MKLEAGLVVVVSADELVKVVRGVADVDAVRSVDQSSLVSVVCELCGKWIRLLKVVELPVVSLLDVKSASLLIGKRLIESIWCPGVNVREEFQN